MADRALVPLERIARIQVVGGQRQITRADRAPFIQLTAAVSNLLLLARPAERIPRPDRARAVPPRISGMERVSRGRSELSYHAAMSLNS